MEVVICHNASWKDSCVKHEEKPKRKSMPYRPCHQFLIPFASTFFQRPDFVFLVYGRWPKWKSAKWYDKFPKWRCLDLSTTCRCHFAAMADSGEICGKEGPQAGHPICFSAWRYLCKNFSTCGRSYQWDESESYTFPSHPSFSRNLRYTPIYSISTIYDGCCMLLWALHPHSSSVVMG